METGKINGKETKSITNHNNQLKNKIKMGEVKMGGRKLKTRKMEKEQRKRKENESNKNIIKFRN